jgi:hypothetical protein
MARFGMKRTAMQSHAGDVINLSFFAPARRTLCRCHRAGLGRRLCPAHQPTASSVQPRRFLAGARNILGIAAAVKMNALGR